MDYDAYHEQRNREIRNNIRAYPVGTRVIVKENQQTNIEEVFHRFEKRGYMIVTGHAENDGWLRFDNEEFTNYGGSWRPSCFKIVKPIEVKLPEELFTL